MSHNNDVAAVITSILIGLFLLYLAIVALVVLLATVAVFIIGWYLTYLVFRLLDEVSEGQLQTAHSGLFLALSAILWSGVAWVVIRPEWLSPLTDIWPAIMKYPVIIPLIGAALGLTWAMLVLFTDDHQAPADILDSAGMYHLSETALIQGEPSALDRLTDSILLGTDVDV